MIVASLRRRATWAVIFIAILSLLRAVPPGMAHVAHAGPLRQAQADAPCFFDASTPLADTNAGYIPDDPDQATGGAPIGVDETGDQPSGDSTDEVVVPPPANGCLVGETDPPAEGETDALVPGDPVDENTVRGGQTYPLTLYVTGCPSAGAYSFGYPAGEARHFTAGNCPDKGIVFLGWQGGVCDNLRAATCNFVMPVSSVVLYAVYGPAAVAPSLVVSIGDSYGSGEGNPDVASTLGGSWKGGGQRLIPRDQDTDCHRSSTAPAAVAANLYASSVGHAVDFMSFACTGDSIGSELSGQGYDPPHDFFNFRHWKLHQLDDIKDAVCTPTCRKIDYLVVSFGGNDLGFQDILIDCISRGLGAPNLPGCDTPGSKAYQSYQENISRLVSLYQQLNDAITTKLRNQGISIGKILVVEYPDLLTDAAAFYCSPNTSGDLTALITLDEARWARDIVVKDMNARLAAAMFYTNNQGRDSTWQYVQGVFDAYLGHGYCAGSSRWINTNADATKAEGALQMALGAVSLGMMHPNKAGQAATGAVIAKYMTGRGVLSVPGGSTTTPPASNPPASSANPRGSGWKQLPGCIKDIATGAEGSTYAIGCNKTFGGYGVFKWNGSNWTALNGGGRRITVASDGAPWIVNDQGAIYRRVNNDWQFVPGCAKDIGAGGNGSMWIVGCNSAFGGYGLYRRDGNNWTSVDGAGVRIAAGPDGLARLVNNQGAIYQRTSSGGWNRLPGTATDIGVGANGAMWITGTDNAYGGKGIYRYTGSNWEKIDGGGVGITVSTTGLPWIVNDQNAVYQRQP
jgi:Tectonin domain